MIREDDLVCDYKFENQTHIWSCIGYEFGLHIWITDRGIEDQLPRHFGGLEVHYRSPPDYMKGKNPSHEKCWLLNAPCWHDGSSLYASERIIPFWKVDKENRERMFEFLRSEYRSRT